MYAPLPFQFRAIVAAPLQIANCFTAQLPPD
jgi:hypothetical protein